MAYLIRHKIEVEKLDSEKWPVSDGFSDSENYNIAMLWECFKSNWLFIAMLMTSSSHSHYN
jgi:hypothetical protein